MPTTPTSFSVKKSETNRARSMWSSRTLALPPTSPALPVVVVETHNRYSLATILCSSPERPSRIPARLPSLSYVPTSPAPMCSYKTNRCSHPRVLKADHSYHSLCQYHRIKQNEAQAKSDAKRRPLITKRRREKRIHVQQQRQNGAPSHLYRTTSSSFFKHAE